MENANPSLAFPRLLAEARYRLRPCLTAHEGYWLAAAAPKFERPASPRGISNPAGCRRNARRDSRRRRGGTGGTVRAAAGAREAGAAALEREPEQEGDAHLRSVREVTGYYVQARDGEIGHVEEFLVETDAWNVRYLVIDTRNWWPGKKALISPHWLESISWEDRQVRCGLSREQIKASPEYDSQVTVHRAYEQALYGHYGRQPYWA